MNNFTAIIDYGVGNLHSVAKALDYVGITNRVTGDKEEISRADALILPGVGAFPSAYEALSKTGLDTVIIEEVQKKPLLGICLGMQLLFNLGYEENECKGLGLVIGEVRRIETKWKLPQIGWNSLEFKNLSPLTKGLGNDSYVYFVHSFCAHAQDEKNVVATCDYGCDVVAMVQNKNVYGCQFHPEKSGEVGLEILKNFRNIF